MTTTEEEAAEAAAEAALAAEGPLLREAALNEGFNTNALVLTDELLRTWARAGASTIMEIAAFGIPASFSSTSISRGRGGRAGMKKPP